MAAVLEESEMEELPELQRRLLLRALARLRDNGWEMRA